MLGDDRGCLDNGDVWMKGMSLITGMKGKIVVNP
jgi:hypothetical protein